MVSGLEPQMKSWNKKLWLRHMHYLKLKRFDISCHVCLHPRNIFNNFILYLSFLFLFICCWLLCNVKWYIKKCNVWVAKHTFWKILVSIFIEICWCTMPVFKPKLHISWRSISIECRKFVFSGQLDNKLQQ